MVRKRIFVVGTSHHQYQVRPDSGPHDGANAFKRYLLETVTTYAIQTIAEEMSVEALNGRLTVGHEIAIEMNLKHALCDPSSLERQVLGISPRGTLLDNMRREAEWLRRLSQGCPHPILFVSGAAHVASFAELCTAGGLQSVILNPDFEVLGIPLDQRII